MLGGQKPILSTLLGNTPCQIVIGEVGSEISFADVVPQYPDVLISGSDFGNIKKKFNITRYEIQGAPSVSANVEYVQALAQNHAQQLQKFQAHLLKSGSMETEYDVLLSLQLENFSYLTSTGISLIGNSVGGTINNMLITQFSPSVEYEEIVDVSGTVRLLQSYSITIENRTITDLDTVV